MQETTPASTGLTLDDAAVIEVLAALYERRVGRMQRLNSEHATVCRITTPEGESLVLKAMTAAHIEPALLRWQASAIERLDDAGIPVPRLIATREGRTSAEWNYRGEVIFLQLSVWMNGRPLADVVPSEATMRSVGSTAASMSDVLAGHDDPPPTDGHIWELHRTAETLTAAREGVADPATRELLARASAEFAQHVAPRLPNLPKGIVHHDLNDFNVLVDPDSAEPLVSAVLDFGDMVAGVRVAELTTAAAYVARLSADPARALVEVARGWLEVAPLTVDERVVLRPAALARLAVNLGVWTARLESDRGEYAGERRGASAAALAALLETDQHSFTAGLDRLVEQTTSER